MSTEWYCPNCGVLHESDVTLVRMVTGLEEDEYCECNECGDVIEQNIPPFVTAMQEEIAKLRAKSARQTEAFEAQWHLHRQATSVREEEIAVLNGRIAEMESVRDRQADIIRRLEDEIALMSEQLDYDCEAEKVMQEEIADILKYGDVQAATIRQLRERIAELDIANEKLQYTPGGDCMSYEELAAEYGKVLEELARAREALIAAWKFDAMVEEMGMPREIANECAEAKYKREIEQEDGK